MRRWRRVFEQALVWLFGAVLMPLFLVVYLVVLKQATFASAVGGGELAALGTSVAAGAVALEFILHPGATGTLLYRILGFVVLLCNLALYMGTVEVHDSGPRVHEVATALDDGQRTASVVLLVIAVLFGVVSVARQAWKDATSPPVVP